MGCPHSSACSWTPARNAPVTSCEAGEILEENLSLKEVLSHAAQRSHESLRATEPNAVQTAENPTRSDL